MRRSVGRALVAALLLPLLATGCGGGAPATKTPLQVRDYPGRLVSTQDMAGAFMLRQRVSAHWPDGERSFEMVVQLSGAELTLLGLTPFGSRAFVLTQKGAEFSYQKYVDFELPFDPRNILNDLHRVCFRGLGEAPNPGFTGERVGTDGAEDVVEVWQQGVLRKKSFRRADGDPAGEIQVVYVGDGEVLPPEVHLSNPWFGYELTIVTLEQTRLP